MSPERSNSAFDGPLPARWAHRVIAGDDPALVTGPSPELAAALLCATAAETVFGRGCRVRSIGRRPERPPVAWQMELRSEYTDPGWVTLDADGVLAVANAAAARYANRVLADGVTEVEKGLADFAALKIVDVLSTLDALSGWSVKVPAEAPTAAPISRPVVEISFTLGGRDGTAWIDALEGHPGSGLLETVAGVAGGRAEVSCRVAEVDLDAEGPAGADGLEAGDVLLIGLGTSLENRDHRLVSAGGWLVARSTTLEHTPTRMRVGVIDSGIAAPRAPRPGRASVAIDVGRGSFEIGSDRDGLDLAVDPERPARVTVPGRAGVDAELLVCSGELGVRLLQTPSTLSGNGRNTRT